MLRAYPCPRLRRLVILKGARDLKAAYSCIRCLFNRSIARSTADRAIGRSLVLLEVLACLADPDRVHLRATRPHEDASDY
jgi:hypothetical protein